MSTVKLHRAIRLAQTSYRRYETLRLTIRDWSHTAAVCRAQEVAYDGDPDAVGETFHRIWVQRPARLRVENEVAVAVADGRRRRIYDRASRSVTSPPAEDADDWLVDTFDHFWDVRWLTRRGVAVVGDAEVAGRRGVELALDPERGSWSFCLLPGTDHYRLVLDAERGIVLRADCFFRTELIAVEEAVEVAFDEELPRELFEELRP